MKKTNDITKITTLNENEIFVFGSNSEGKHDGGAANDAINNFGAIYGQARGLQGQSYAIVTMSGLQELECEVEDFILFVKRHPKKTFVLTEIGCGIAGFSVEQVAPMFFRIKGFKNIVFPVSFSKFLKEYSPVLKTYKAFNKDLSCHDFQFEIGKEYVHGGILRICESGFHSCENPLNVLTYYDLTESRFAETEVEKDLQFEAHDSKVVSRKIRVKSELNFHDFIKASVDFVFGAWFKRSIYRCQNVSSGPYSKNASSGSFSQNASSDPYSKNVSSGSYSYNASSGSSSYNASSGLSSKNASSGSCSYNASSGSASYNASSGSSSHNASSGSYSYNASSGSSSYNASSGSSSQNVNSGSASYNASSGEHSKNASSGPSSYNASSGPYSQNASGGSSSQNASSGPYSKNASSGSFSQNASSGPYSKNASSGPYSQNASSGPSSTIKMTGAQNVGCAIGIDSKISGINGNLICLVNYNNNEPIGWITGKIGENGLKENTFYKAGKDGNFIEA